VLVLLDGSPAMFLRPGYVERTTAQIVDGTIQHEVMSLVHDMASSGTLDADDAADIPAQFAAHFEQGSGPRWVARFCTAYVAHLLMGLRAIDDLRHGGNGGLKDGDEEVASEPPAARTIFIRATDGMGVRRRADAEAESQVKSDASSEPRDRNWWTSEAGVETHSLPGTHFGMLHPRSGIVEVLNEVLQA